MDSRNNISKKALRCLLCFCSLLMFSIAVSCGGGGNSTETQSSISDNITEGYSAYVTTNDPSTGLGFVAVINCSDNSVEDLIASEDLYDYDQITATPDGKFVYTTCYAPGKLAKISTLNNEIVKVFDVYSGAKGVEVTSNGSFVYAVSANIAGVLAKIGVSDDIMTEIPIMQLAAYLALTPDSDSAYLSSSSSIGVLSYLKSENPIVENINAVGSSYENMIVSPDGEYLYVLSGMYPEALMKININDHNDIMPISLDSNDPYNCCWSMCSCMPYGLAASPDGKWIYVTCLGNGYVAIIDTSLDRMVNTIKTGNIPRGIAFTPDGKSAYVCSGDVYVIDVEEQTLTGDKINVGTRALDVTIVQ